jgi:hypothetical protein
VQKKECNRTCTFSDYPQSIEVFNVHIVMQSLYNICILIVVSIDYAECSPVVVHHVQSLRLVLYVSSQYDSWILRITYYAIFQKNTAVNC